MTLLDVKVEMWHIENSHYRKDNPRMSPRFDGYLALITEKT